MVTEHELAALNEERALRLRDLFDRDGLTLAAMESCTGGMLASTLTDVPESGYLLGGAVAYDAGAKCRFGVPREAIEVHGVVSGAVAREMASAAARWFEAGVGVAITGVAGPSPQDGCSPGTVIVSAWREGRPPEVREHWFPGDRRQVKLLATGAAILLLEEYIGAGRVATHSTA